MNPYISYWIALLVAAIATSMLLAQLLGRAQALPLDCPNERSLHQRPTPRVGGLAVFPGVVLACLLAGQHHLALLVPLALAGLLFLISVADDWRSLPAGMRFSSHLAVAAGFALWIAGATPLALAGAIAMAWMTNLYNFMDGANGLAGGMSAIGFGVLALASEEPLLACAVVGAALGFLRYNFDPARVFLGDAGSVPLGFLAGALCFVGVARGHWPLWFPLLVFAPFVIDATVTLLKRLARREKVWSAHRQHYYQRLVRMGWSHRRLALAEYALMLICGGLALLLLTASPAWQATGVVGCLVLHAALMFSIDCRWNAMNKPA